MKKEKAQEASETYQKKNLEVTGTEAEDIRSANRRLIQIRMDISEAIILLRTLDTQKNKLNVQLDEKYTDFVKQNEQFNGLIATAASRLGINLNVEKDWKFNIDSLTFSKE